MERRRMNTLGNMQATNEHVLEDYHPAEEWMKDGEPEERITAHFLPTSAHTVYE